MKFEEVLPALREGKKVTSTLINGINCEYMYYSPEDGEFYTEKGSRVYLFSNEFMTINDWEIVEEPKKIKLRDLTEKEFQNWKNEKCEADCEHCIFENVGCAEWKNNCWVRNKNLYSNKFLNQEIEIEIADEPLLTPKEKEYLENVIKPFKDTVISISKKEFFTNRGYIYIGIKDYNSNLDYVKLPNFVKNKYYKGLEIDREYTLEDLGLFQENKYKITLTEFWNSKDKLAIHCNTREKADKFLKESNKTGKWGDFGSCYGVYREKTCYCNESNYDELEYYIVNNYTIYEFEDVDLEN